MKNKTLKGCGKQVYKKENTKCGEWFGGDQHFCKECFNKYHYIDEEGNLHEK